MTTRSFSKGEAIRFGWDITKTNRKNGYDVILCCPKSHNEWHDK